jgi:hypothetical protein
VPHLSHDVLIVGGFISQALGNLYMLYRLRRLRRAIESVRSLVTR